MKKTPENAVGNVRKFEITRQGETSWASGKGRASGYKCVHLSGGVFLTID